MDQRRRGERQLADYGMAAEPGKTAGHTGAR